jgi:hypothetical protein
MMLDIFVVAGNYEQYQFICDQAQEAWKEELKRKQVHYVEGPDTLSGVHGARVFLVGTYYMRPDWEAIDMAIRNGGHRPLLMK